MSEPKIVKQGYVVITPTLVQGDVMVWSVLPEDKEWRPLVFDTVRDAQLEQLEALEYQISEFKDGDREFDEIYFNLKDEYIAGYTEYEDGKIQVRYLDETNDSVFIETTLEKWRAER